MRSLYLAFLLLLPACAEEADQAPPPEAPPEPAKTVSRAELDASPSTPAAELREEDRIEIYAEVLRQFLRGEGDPRGGIVIEPAGLLGLSDLRRLEVLVALEDVTPEAFFGTRAEIEAEQQDREEARNEREAQVKRKTKTKKARDRGGSSTATTPVEVTAIEDELAPTLVLWLDIQEFRASRARIRAHSWHADSGERSEQYIATRSGSSPWRVRASGGIRPPSEEFQKEVEPDTQGAFEE